jgi:hypothetical protein
MKKLFLLLGLLLTTFVTNSQNDCFQFGRSKHVRRVRVNRCYNFNGVGYSGDGALKLGIAQMPIMFQDRNGLPYYNVMAEMDYGDWGGGVQADIRVGNTYINTNILPDAAPLSIDTRWIGFFKPDDTRISYGGYAQLNSTNMWVDGWAFGGLVRYSYDWELFGIYAQALVPAINRQIRLVSLGKTEKNWYWFGIPEDRDFKSTRLTEYRIHLGIYLRIPHKYYEIKRF